ncbi:MAG: flagellar filament capping protein FliD [Rickettsiales endosymbiont of Dermacentor nuttalli]
MAVNFGSFSEIGGRQVITGIASNLDSQKMIEAMLKAEEIPLKKVEDSISANARKISAYHTLENLVTSFQSALNKFYDPLSVTGYNEDVFHTKQISLSANTNINTDHYLTVEQKFNTDIKSFYISDINLATRETSRAEGFHDVQSSIVSTIASPGQFTAGTFQINGVDITLNDGDSLQNIAQSINNVSTDTKVKASILKLDQNNYQLSLSSLDEGIENAFIYTDDYHIFFDNSNITWQHISAQDASFKFNGSQVTRPTNSIEDLVNGLKINLRQNTSTGTEIKANITYDIDTIIKDTQEFVNSFNTLMVFYEQMNQRDEITYQYSKNSPLGGDVIFEGIINNIKSLVNTNLWDITSKSKYTSFASIGINFLLEKQNIVVENPSYDPSLPKSESNSPTTILKVDGVLQLDEKKLRNILQNDIEDVRKLFTMEYNSTNNNFGVKRGGNDTSIQNLEINIIKTNSVTELLTKTINSNSESLVSNTPTKNQYTAGKFKINNTNITITAGQNIRDIANTINSLIPNISATVIKKERDKHNILYTLKLLPSNGASSFTIDDPDKLFFNNPNMSIFYKLSPNSVTVKYKKKHYTNIINLNAQSTSSGFTLTCPNNSDLSGLIVNYYGGHAPDYTIINYSQGLMYQLYKYTSTFINSGYNGITQNAIQALEQADLFNKAEKIRLNEILNRRKTELLERFAMVESSIAKVNSVLKFLDNDETSKRMAAR